MSEERPYVPLDKFAHPREHSSRVIPLWVNGAPPHKLGISPEILDFGGQLLNGQTVPLTIILTNTGFMPLDITSVALVGAAFSMQPVAARTLEPGQILAIPIVFAPTDIGLSQGTLTISIAELGIRTVAIKGTGTWDYIAQVDTAINRLWGFLQRAVRPALTDSGPIISLPNTSIEFATEVPVGDDSELFLYTISNVGSQNVVLDNLQVTGDFVLVTP